MASSVGVRTDRVSNRTLRREFERRVELGWITPQLVAVRLGWMYGKGGKPDDRRVLKVLGMIEAWEGGKWRRYTSLTYERAGEIARAMDCDPWEVDL